MWTIESLEGHWLACMASAGGGGQVTRLGGATVLTNPHTPSTMLNCMLLKNVAPDRLEAVLEAGRMLLSDYGRPTALFVTPLAGDPEALQPRLGALGWRQALQQVALIRPLDRLPPAEPAPAVPPPAGLEVLETTDRERWGRLLTDAYEVPEALGGPIRIAWTRLQGDAHYYLTHSNGRPVGTGLTWQQGPVAGLYAGAVLPAFRRRGVERASILRRLHDARHRGALYAWLQTEVGSPVDQLCQAQLGFVPVYERSLWAKAEPQ